VAERDDDKPKYGLINNISTCNPFALRFTNGRQCFMTCGARE
jgi:hypothetical protein